MTTARAVCVLFTLLAVFPAASQGQQLSNVIDFREVTTADCLILPTGLHFDADCGPASQSSYLLKSGVRGVGRTENADAEFAVSRISLIFDLDIDTTYDLDIQHSAESVIDSQFIFRGPEFDYTINTNSSSDISFDELPRSGELAAGNYVFLFDHSNDVGASEFFIDLSIVVIPEPTVLLPAYLVATFFLLRRTR